MGAFFTSTATMSAPPQATATAVSKKALRRKEAREPKVVENPKKCMFIKGPKSSETLNELLNDLCSLKKPHSIKYQRKNQIRPFEDDTSLEFFAQKSDASQFVMSSHTKKRPSTIILGRLFNYHLLDMVELTISNYKSASSFTNVKQKPMAGGKPAIIFQGSEFENSEDHKRTGNLFIDIFRLHEVNKIDLSGLDRVIVCSTLDGVILFRQYMVKLLKSGTRVPRVELEEVGPSFDCSIGRTKFASTDLMKEALRLPPQLQGKKKKNKSTNIFGDKLGTIHMERQDLDTLTLARMKAFKRKRKTSEDGEPESKKQRVSDDEE